MIFEKTINNFIEKHIFGPIKYWCKNEFAELINSWMADEVLPAIEEWLEKHYKKVPKKNNDGISLRDYAIGNYDKEKSEFVASTEEYEEETILMTESATTINEMDIHGDVSDEVFSV